MKWPTETLVTDRGPTHQSVSQYRYLWLSYFHQAFNSGECLYVKMELYTVIA